MLYCIVKFDRILVFYPYIDAISHRNYSDYFTKNPITYYIYFKYLIFQSLACILFDCNDASTHFDILISLKLP